VAGLDGLTRAVLAFAVVCPQRGSSPGSGHAAAFPSPAAMSQRAGQSIEVNFDTKVETLLVDDAMLILREDDINISDEEDRVDSFVEDEPAAKRSIMDVAAHAAGGLGTHAVGILGIDKDALQGSDERSMEMVGLEAQWFIIHPHSLMLKIWDSIQALIVTYLFFYLPIVIAFKNTDLELQVQGLLLEGEEPPTMHTTYDYIIDAILLMDYLTRPLRAYYHIDYYGTQVLVVDPAQITVKWLRGGFFRDSLSCLPFDAVLRLAGHPKTASWVRGLRLLRMESVIQVKSNLYTALDEAVGSSWLRPLVSSVSLLIMALFFNHVLACFLYFFGHPKWDVELSKSADAVAWATQNPERSTREYCHEVEGGRCGWVQEMEYEPRTSDFTKYIDAFYYSFTILTTVGFGDISAHATRERVAAVFAMILGCAVFGIVMGQITAVLHGLHMGQARYEEKIRELEQYMEYRGLSHSLRERAKRFYIRKFPTKRLYDEKQILMGLPQGLRTEFLLDMNKVHIEKLPFVPKDDHPVMIAVCRALKQETFMPGEIVAREGAVGRSVFLVMSGVVSVLVARSEAARLGIHRQREAQRRKHGMQSRRYLSMDVESTFDLDEQPSPSQLPEASEDDSSTMVNPLAQDRVAGVNDEPAVGSEAADSEDWDEVRRLDDGEWCLAQLLRLTHGMRAKTVSPVASDLLSPLC
jgi:hypothetical protein